MWINGKINLNNKRMAYQYVYEGNYVYNCFFNRYSNVFYKKNSVIMTSWYKYQIQYQMNNVSRYKKC